jgi:uroporphyrinogen decarboxylase
MNSLPDRLEYIPVTQGVRFAIDPEHEFDVLHIVRRKIGEGISLHGEVTSPFDYYLDFLGHQEGLLDLIDSPAKARGILDHFTRLVRECAVRMCASGVDAIKVSSPYAGAGFISRCFYSEYVLPYEAEIAHAVRGKGVHVYTHTCGAVGDRLDLMVSAGISGIECLDPPPLGNVDLAEAKSKLAGKAFIKGNIDSVSVLLDGSPEEILADAGRRIEVGKRGGGFILSTACSVAPRVPPDHLLLLREAVDRWGNMN